MGCREFPASFALVEGALPTPAEELQGERDLGWMLYDIDFANGMQPAFFRPVMTDGVIDVARFAPKEFRP
jgi:CRISPR-associated protein Cas5d